MYRVVAGCLSVHRRANLATRTDRLLLITREYVKLYDNELRQSECLEPRTVLAYVDTLQIGSTKINIIINHKQQLTLLCSGRV